MSLRDSLLGFHDFIYCIYQFRIYILVLMGKLLHGYINNLLGKNLSQYSPIRAWFVISFVTYAHNKLESPKYFSQVLSLEYIKWICWLSLLFELRKCFPLKLDAWKYICHFLTIELHSFFFLLNFHNILLGTMGLIL